LKPGTPSRNGVALDRVVELAPGLPGLDHVDGLGQRHDAGVELLEHLRVRLLDALRLPEGVSARADLLRRAFVGPSLALGGEVASGHFV
jgi:hypothetical protein